MRKSTVILILVLLLLIQNSSIAGVQVFGVDKYEYSQSIQKTWNKLENKFDIKQSANVYLKKMEGRKNSFYAQTLGQNIFINDAVSPTLKINTISHEVHHVFLNSVCGLPSQEYPLIHEVFAMWFNDDYLRIASSQNKFHYRSQAKKWLQQYSKEYNSKLFSYAIARLLSVSGKREKLNNFFRNLIQTCKNKSSLSVYEDKLFKILNLEKPILHKKQKTSFVLYDMNSYQFVQKDGRYGQLDRVASTLKPLLFVLSPRFFSSKLSEKRIEWACPEIKSLSTQREWDWTEALAKSCNGFFLARQKKTTSRFKKEWESYHHFIGRESLINDPKVSQVVGLLDGLKLTLEEIIKTYLYIFERQPDVIKALKKTTEIGTASGFKEAQWFKKNRIVLKTGSIRSSKGAPELSLIVALGMSSDYRKINFISVIRSHGVSTQTLSYNLYKKLQPYVRLLKSVEVQTLGLVEVKDLDFLCNKLFYSPKKLNWSKVNRINPQQIGFYKCKNSPLKVELKRAGKKVLKQYNGIIEVRALVSKKRKSHITRKMHKARAGSPFIFHTSLYNYLLNSIGAEFPNGRLEVLKALVVSSHVNVHSNRHKERPICDTTHCQVLKPFSKLSSSRKRKIKKAIKYVYQDNILTLYEDRKWLPFYLGGSKPWSQSVDIQKLQKRINQTIKVESIRKEGNKVRLLGGNKEISVNCEFFRNQLNLYSCPEIITKIDKNIWSFSGFGEGHGIGIDLLKANHMAAQGKLYYEILDHFYSNN